MYAFIGAFAILEISILAMKLVIYQSGKIWSDSKIGPLQATFLGLHMFRIVFPATLAVKFWEQIRFYLSQVRSLLTKK